jgi:hypothetical protein
MKFCDDIAMSVPNRRSRGVRAALVVTLTIITGLPRDAAAQMPRSLELSAGYAYLRDPRLDLNLPVGWSIGAAAKFNSWLSAVADVGSSHTTFPTILGDLAFGLHAVLIGARASARVGPFVEFGQILAGIVHARGSAFGTTSSSTHFGAQAGAGVDCPVKGPVSVRLEVDFRLVGADEGVGLGREVRGLAAVAYRVF